MSISTYIYSTTFSDRIFLSWSLTQDQLKEKVDQDFSKYIGASIKVHTYAGPFFKFLGLATPWHHNGRVYFLNTKSLKKYFYRQFCVFPASDPLPARVAKIYEYLKLPCSPLSILNHNCHRFKINPLTWMQSMTSKYNHFCKLGYDASVIAKLKPTLMVAVLSGHMPKI